MTTVTRHDGTRDEWAFTRRDACASDGGSRGNVLESGCSELHIGDCRPSTWDAGVDRLDHEDRNFFATLPISRVSALLQLWSLRVKESKGCSSLWTTLMPTGRWRRRKTEGCGEAPIHVQTCRVDAKSHRRRRQGMTGEGAAVGWLAVGKNPGADRGVRRGFRAGGDTIAAGCHRRGRGGRGGVCARRMVGR